MKYIVKNCPAYVLMRTATSGTYFNICGNAKGHIKCCNIDDCTIKQIVELCKEKIKVCEGCSKTADINIDCVECDEKGEANLSRAIVNLLEIEEVNEELFKRHIK